MTNRNRAVLLVWSVGAAALIATWGALSTFSPPTYPTVLFLTLIVFGTVTWYAARHAATTDWQEELREMHERAEEARNGDASWDSPSLTHWVHRCHEASVRGGWWHNLESGRRLARNKGEMLMLMVSEIAEAMEGERRDRMDDKLPHRKMAEVELADAFIRIADYAGGFGYDLESAVREKMAYNARRADHKPENRALAGGKKF